MITQQDIIYFVITDRFKNSLIPDEATDPSANIRAYYGGDFKGIEQKIDYLKALGITALWITPVYLNIGEFFGTDSYHGYWTVAFDKVDPILNPGQQDQGKAAFQQLVAKLNAQGIKVILDMVVNHTGYHNETYTRYHQQQREANPDYEVLGDHWFNRDGQGTIKGELAGLPDLNHDLADVRDYFVNNITDWIEETGIDAIRMDTVKHVEDAFWYAFKAYIRGRFPDITLIGEVLSPDAGSIARYQTLMDFDSLFDFPLQQTIVSTLVKEGPMTWLARPRVSEHEPPGVLDVDTRYYTNANRLVTLLDNHDLDIGRIKTAILDHVGHWDRQLAMKVLKACLAFLFTTRGIPQLYYGTEIGMEGGKDPYNRGVFRWDWLDKKHQGPEALEARETFVYVQKLIRLRHHHPCLQYGYLFTLYVDHFVYAYLREYRGDVVIVAINNGRGDMPHPLRLHIEANTNLPRRIKERLRGQSLLNALDESETMTLSSADVDVQLKGKEVKLLTLSPA